MATGHSKNGDIPMKQLCQEAALKLNAFHLNKEETTIEKEEPLQTSTPETSLSGKLRIIENCNPNQDQTSPKTEIKLLTELGRIGPRANESLSSVHGWEMNTSNLPHDMAYQIPLNNRDLKNISCSMFYPPPPPPSLRSLQDASTLEEPHHTEEANVPQVDCASGCLEQMEQHCDSVTDIPAEISQNEALLCSDNPVVPAATRIDAEQKSAPVSPTHLLLPPPYTGRSAATGVGLPFTQESAPVSPTHLLLPPPYTGRSAATGVGVPYYTPSQYPVYPVAHAAAAPSQPTIIQQHASNDASQENMIGDRSGREGYQNHKWIYLSLSVMLLILSICNPTLLIFAIPAYIASLIILITSDTEAYPCARHISKYCTLAGCCCFIVEIFTLILFISIIAIIGATTGSALLYLGHFFAGGF